jgi:putative membrane protein
VILAVAIVPGLSFSGWRWGQGLAIAVVFAVLNAVVKPALQFLSLRFLFSSYGIVIVLINTLLLALLDWILGERIEASGVLPVLLGGALIGLIGAAIDAMLGADPPPLDREYKERNGLA